MTTHAAVLGSPIAHSLSPVLHNAAYRALGLSDWQYSRSDVTELTLENFFTSLDPSWAGVSMTMPLKKKALEFGEICDERVDFLRVTNTAVFDWSRANAKHSDLPYISLYNTDVDGVKLTFRDEFGIDDAPDLTALILGSGSTATSAIAALIEMGIRRFTVCAKDEAQARAVSQQMSSYLNSSSTLTVKTWTQASYEFEKHDIIISAVPAFATDELADGLFKELHSQALNGKQMLDVIYDPRPTKLMESAASLGASVRGGEHMLLRQALAQVAYMTHIPVTEVISTAFARMRTALIEHL